MTFGRPGATSCTSTEKPSRRSQASTAPATARSLASGSPGRKTLGMRTSCGGEVDDLALGDLAQDAVDGERDISNGPAAGGRMERSGYSRGKARMTESRRRTRNSSPLT